MRGFTLIELAIVLVIIGLLVGGVLVGQDLVRAAGERAQITQIEKYNIAVNTFRAKYNALPGDLPEVTAAQFGFSQRGTWPGQGDGDGILESVGVGYQQGGETTMFWSDLTYANGLNLNMIEGSFSSVTPTAPPAFPATTRPVLSFATGLEAFFPRAKIGDNFILVSGFSPWGNTFANNSFYVSTLYGSWPAGSAAIVGKPGLTVKQAYDIDVKTDDGLPWTGRIRAAVWSGLPQWLEGGTYGNGGLTDIPYLYGNFPADPTTCVDNNGSVTNLAEYSISQNGGIGMNCALSFRFQ